MVVGMVGAMMLGAYACYAVAHLSAAAKRRQQARMLMILEYIPA